MYVYRLMLLKHDMIFIIEKEIWVKNALRHN